MIYIYNYLIEYLKKLYITISSLRGEILAVAALTVMRIIASRKLQSNKLLTTRHTIITDTRRSRQGDSNQNMEFQDTFEWEVWEFIISFHDLNVRTSGFGQQPTSPTSSRGRQNY